MKKRILKKTIDGRKSVTANVSRVKASAIMVEVNKIMGIYGKDVPYGFRGAIMVALYEAINEGGLRIYTGVSITGKNAGVTKTRHLIRAGTSYTPYKHTTAPWDGRRNIKDRILNTGGISVEKWLTGVCELFVNGEVNPISGITKQQYADITKKCFGNYRVRTDEDTILELI